MVSHQCVFSCNNWGDFSLRKFDHNFCIGFFSVYIMLQLRFFSLRIFFHIACIDMVSHPCSHIIIEDIFFCKKELSHWHHWYGFPKCVSSFGNWGNFYLRKVYHIPCIEMASPQCVFSCENWGPSFYEKRLITLAASLWFCPGWVCVIEW